MSDNEIKSYYRYWGKADLNYPGELKWHPLVYHCLDVAVVGHVWWYHSSSLRSQSVRELNRHENEIYSWVIFFMALHDYGKFDVRFQMKIPELAGKIYSKPPSNNPDKKYDHGDSGFMWFVQDIEDLASEQPLKIMQKRSLEEWLQKTAGHHGKIPVDAEIQEPAFTAPEIIKQDKQARLDWITELKKMFLEPYDLDYSDIPDSVPSILAGFCSVCDWIGSNSDYFRLTSEATGDLKGYFESRFANAQDALNDLGLLSKIITTGGMKSIFPEYASRGLQKQVDQYRLFSGLTIIEAPTGSGKTEAALAYASCLLAKGLAESIIFALPTQATANAMLIRIEEVADRLFEGGANVVLAHGKRDYNKSLIDLKESSKLLTAEGKNESLVQCSEWLASSKKRVFLGQIGVCTIDQVLLSVLPVRHNFVRGFGVQKSILIIDEVHAYDSYMYGLLNEVLKKQNQAGGSAILLSATLPQYQRNQLLRSWGHETECENSSYPLVTQTDSENIVFYDLEEKDQPEKRSVKTEIWESEYLKISSMHLEKIIKAAEEGAMVVVICNLVADAQKAADQLTEKAKIPIDLFHSRFRFIDRQNHEENVKKRYGKNSDRSGRILVATQVVEQSLDLDFDWLITQLCPVDLLFQRLGRLHRHNNERPEAYKETACVIIVPPKDSLDYGKSKYVYQNHRALWRTQKLLEENKEIIFPEAYRDWIEKVYQEEAWGDEPEIIEQGYEKYEMEQDARRYTARQMCNSGMNPVSDDDDNVAMLTRDGAMAITVIPVLTKGKNRFTLEGELFDELEDWQRWEMINQHSVGVPQSWRSSLPEADKNGVHYLEMHTDAPKRWRADFEGGHFIYSRKRGLERKLT